MLPQLEFHGPAQEVLKGITANYIEPAVPASAPGPPEDYREKRVSLDNLFKIRASTYLWTIRGDSMIGAGIHSGDQVLVDRAIKPYPGCIVVAIVNGEPTVKRFAVDQDRPLLLPENPNHKPVPVNEEDGLTIWGVVQSVHHWLIPRK